MMKPGIRSLGMAVVLSFMAVSAHADERLFSFDIPQNKALFLDPSYLALAESPSTASLQLVEVRRDALREKTASLTLNLAPGLELRAHRVDSYRNPSGSMVWSGVIENPDGLKTSFSPDSVQFDAVNSALLVRNGDKITGNVHFNGQLYQIRPLKSGGHAIVEVEESALPPDHPAGYNPPVVPMPVRQEKAKPKPPRGPQKSTINVMVYYTPFVNEKAADIDGMIELAVAESNEGYANSGVLINLVLVHKALTLYGEGDIIKDLNRFMIRNDGRMDEVHEARDTYGADVAILIVDNQARQACGVAAGIGSTATSAFAILHWECTAGNSVFAHEIGHLLSARHDPSVDPSSKPFAYGHGYQYTQGPRWRTIMAYPCQGLECPRVNYWSNPKKKYNGKPMGTTALNDNVRVLNMTRIAMAGFR
ncbi:MAG TPA: M12 family metallo-peptidase [Thermoanaerobaculia bacterium]